MNAAAEQIPVSQGLGDPRVGRRYRALLRSGLENARVSEPPTVCPVRSLAPFLRRMYTLSHSLASEGSPKRAHCVGAHARANKNYRCGDAGRIRRLTRYAPISLGPAETEGDFGRDDQALATVVRR